MGDEGLGKFYLPTCLVFAGLVTFTFNYSFYGHHQPFLAFGHTDNINAVALKLDFKRFGSSYSDAEKTTTSNSRSIFSGQYPTT